VTGRVSRNTEEGIADVSDSTLHAAVLGPEAPEEPATRALGALTPEGQPRRMRAATLLLAVPGLAQQFDPVPGAYVGHMGGGERLVCCPCGGRPIVGRGELVACESARRWVPARTDCPRWFVGANRSVLVFGGKR
jgi:hypothetical protein